MTTSTRTEQHLTAINAIYEAFGRGDIPAILDHIAPDVDWEIAYAADLPIPWLRRGTGRDHVAMFFATFFELADVQSFEIREFLANEGTIAVLVDIECTVRATGKRIKETEEPHIWHFNDEGKVARFRHAADTLQQYLALQP